MLKKEIQTTYENKALDELDIRILLLIFGGVDSCSYLTNFMNRHSDTPMAKQTISDRVARMSKMGFVRSVETDRRHYYRAYELANYTRGTLGAFLKNYREDLNLSLLISKALHQLDSNFMPDSL